MWFKIVLGVTTIVAITAGTIPLLQPGDGNRNDKSIMTYRVTRGDLSVTVTENGMLESSNNEEIKCMVKGGSTVLWVIETGTIVKAGDLLSRANAMIKASRSVSKGPIAKRPLAAKKPAARKPVGGKKKPCRIA